MWVLGFGCRAEVQVARAVLCPRLHGNFSTSTPGAIKPVVRSKNDIET